MKRFKAYVNIPQREWKVSYADEVELHRREFTRNPASVSGPTKNDFREYLNHAFTRNPGFVFDTIKKNFREYLIELVHQRMVGPEVLTDADYRLYLVELAECFKEVMFGFKVIHPDFEVDKGISVHRFISRLEVMEPEGISYLLGALFPDNSRMIRVLSPRLASELWRLQDDRVRSVIEVQMFRLHPVDMTYRTNSIHIGNMMPAEAMRLTFERICTIDDVDVISHLKQRAEHVLNHESLSDIMEGVREIKYPQ